MCLRVFKHLVRVFIDEKLELPGLLLRKKFSIRRRKRKENTTPSKTMSDPNNLNNNTLDDAETIDQSVQQPIEPPIEQKIEQPIEQTIDVTVKPTKLVKPRGRPPKAKPSLVNDMPFENETLTSKTVYSPKVLRNRQK